jgi:hypothetical protein
VPRRRTPPPLFAARHFSRNAPRPRPNSPHARELAVSRAPRRGSAMSAIGGSGNYISDSQIMVWLANQQDRIYGDLKVTMDLSEKRADFSEALTKIKAHLGEANRNKDFGTVDAELQALKETYGSDPNFAETLESLQVMTDKIHTDYENVKNHDLLVADYKKQLLAYTQAVGNDPYRVASGLPSLLDGLKEPTAPGALVKSYDEKQIDDWNTSIDGKLDHSSKNDQLTMIHIQELKATLDQGAQLGSSFISSGDKTSSAIINNIA